MTGLDATANALDVAKRHAKDHNLNINYLCSSIEEFSQDNVTRFDAIVASEVVGELKLKIMGFSYGGQVMLGSQNM